MRAKACHLPSLAKPASRTPFQLMFQSLKKRLLLLLSTHLAICQAGYTNIEQYPGFDLLRQCAQCSLSCSSMSALQILMGCENWNCVCGNFDAAMSSASKFVMEECTRTQDVSSATSILNAFCYQLSAAGSVTPITAPTAVGDPGSGKVTATPTDRTPFAVNPTIGINVAGATGTYREI